MNKIVRFFLQPILILLIFFTLLSGVKAESTQLFDLNFKNADIKDVLRALADQEGVSFIIDNEITGMITVHLTKVSFTDALNIIASNNGLTYTKENRVYRISKIDNSIIKVEYTDGLLSVEAREAKLGTLLETISRKTGVNLVPAPDLQDRISITLIKTPLTDGIKAVLTQGNCAEEVIGKVSYIRKKAVANFPINYQNEKLTLDAQNIPLPALARAITEKTGVTVVPDQNLNMPVTIYFQELSLEEALTVICETHGLQLIREEQSWRITKRSGAFRVKVKDNLLTIDADGVDLVQILNEISRQSGINIMTAKDVRDTVTAHFQNLPVFQGLNLILEPRNLIIEKHKNYYYILANKSQNQNIRISYDPETELYDLEVQSAPVTAIMDEMARRADLNLVVLPQVNWTVNNIRLRKQKFTQILDYLLKGTVLTYMVSDGTYVIGDGLMIRPENRDFGVVKIYPVKYLKVDQLFNTLPPVFPKQNFVQMQEKNAMIVTAPVQIHKLFEDYLAQVDIPGIDDRTEVIKIKYLKAEDVLKLIPPSIPKNDLIIIKEANAIAATGPQNYLNQVRQYIEKIDQVNPMIVFDIMVVSINSKNNLNWAPPAQFSINGKTINTTDDEGMLGVLSISKGSGEITTSINALVEKGQAKILQNPTISALNGYPTSFSVDTKITKVTKAQVIDGTTIASQKYEFNAGIYVTITPWVSAENQITMEIKPQLSEFGNLSAEYPDVTSRKIESTIRVDNEQPVVIGGLKTLNKSKSIKKIPILGDIPFLGHLFKTTTEIETVDEFVIIVTPHLAYNDVTKNKINQDIKDKFNVDELGTLPTNIPEQTEKDVIKEKEPEPLKQ